MAIDLTSLNLDMNMLLGMAITVVLFVVLLIVGWIVGHVVGSIVKWILKRKPLRLDKRLEEWEVDDAIGHISLSNLLGKLTKWFVFGIFLSQASGVLNLGVISDILGLIVLYIPKIILAIIVVVATLIIADFVSDRIRKTKSKLIDIIGIVVKTVIIVFGVILAGEQLNFRLDFLIVMIQDIVRALIWGAAVAFAIAIGLGYGLDKRDSRSTIPQTVENMWKDIK